MQIDQLRALLAVVDEGTFEAAAGALGITPSAVSQRIKALEAAAGRVLVERSAPVRATAAGTAVARTARQMVLLADQLRADLGEGGSAPVELPVAVNADSLATWFEPVLATAAGWPDTLLHLEVEDEEYSADHLRRGAVVGAVTADPTPVAGCRTEPLGSMRYLPVAAAPLAEEFAKGRGHDWERMPVLRFNAKDDLQHGVLRDLGVDVVPPTSQVPSSEGFAAAVRAGLGWAMLPEAQVGDDLDTGRLVLLRQREHRDVPLYWQAWTLRTARIERLGEAVHEAARALRPVRPTRTR
ncbi:LysR family transcriptional regulator ArgP [Janibacter sp. YB324]|uniref:LysR family transcriptional regulator ArgP n=1 Tax=Janibacter sp. YB324 TaxID=2761047 RepID=UPI00162A46CE|nr:LysR family transcriptional regulator ArgP [Janibacter sp. YB324]QNF93127.1 LysR family transcriptional regulator ArgP [Janibacter sp. YB324]